MSSVAPNELRTLVQRCLFTVICGPMLAALLGCNTSPTAPSSLPPPPASPFATFTGYYTLTFEIDEKCAEFPQSLRVRVYDTVLEDPGWHFVPIWVIGGGFSTPRILGDLFPDRALNVPQDNSRFVFRWNDDYEYPEPPIGSTQLNFYGSGPATLTEQSRAGYLHDSTISGTIFGDAFITGDVPRIRPCAGSHRFTFLRPTR